MAENKYDMLYEPDEDPRLKYHKCTAPVRGVVGSIVGCKDCGQLWYFRYKPEKWYRNMSMRFIKVRWYHWRLRSLL